MGASEGGEGNTCSTNHYESVFYPYEVYGEGVVYGVFYCDDCGLEAEAYALFVDSGDGHHAYTVYSLSMEVITSGEEEHYSDYILMIYGLSECPCGAGDTHQHSYYLTNIEMINSESGTATLHCEGCDFERDYAFTVEYYDDEDHYFLDSGDDDWVDFLAPHDFTNGDCICGEKAPN